MKKQQSITMSIPGGWFGNDPGSLVDPREGNVIIDASRTVPAIKWLSRRAEIIETYISYHYTTPGLHINYRVKRGG
jgi:hypothetical protein